MTPDKLILHQIDTKSDDPISNMLKWLMIKGDPVWGDLKTMGIMTVPGEENDQNSENENDDNAINALQGAASEQFIDSIKVKLQLKKLSGYR
jgi:hypothetical protein